MSPELLQILFFGLVYLTFATLEWALPLRQRRQSRFERWPINLGLVAFSRALIWIILPLTAAQFALKAETSGWGLLNMTSMPAMAEWLIAFMVLDLVIYLQHQVFHYVPWLWRLHRVHHTDLDFDVTTGVRFHPIEIALSMGIKFVAIAAIGAPASAVLAFEIVLNATSVFNHANLRMPKWLERGLRWLVVTPDMHRIHHSTEVKETNSNFGFNLSLWDRLFGTYKAQARLEQTQILIGIAEYQEPRDLGFFRLLRQPFNGRSPSEG